MATLAIFVALAHLALYLWLHGAKDAREIGVRLGLIEENWITRLARTSRLQVRAEDTVRARRESMRLIRGEP